MDLADPRMCVPDEEPATTAPAPTVSVPAESEHHHIEPAEEENPVAKGLSYIDYAHLAGDAAVDGNTAAETLPGTFHEMGEDALKVRQGDGTVAQTGMKGITAIASPLAIAGGVIDMVEGANEIRHGDAPDGVIKESEGILMTGSGVSGLAGLASGTGATFAPVLGAGVTGLAIGHYGDEHAKELGLFHDDQGRAESASDWAGGKSADADNWVAQHSGSKALGTTAGVGTWAGTSIVGAGASALSAAEGGAHAVANGAHRLWDWL
jgi:hypothetical protein